MGTLQWLVAASVVASGLLIHSVAHACTCGPFVFTAGFSGPQPANGLMLLGSCSDELPVEQLGVRIDGRAAALTDAGIEVGPNAALLRIEPVPMDGQTVTFDAGPQQDQGWPLVYGPTEWTVGPVDDAPPVATATVTVHTGDAENDGLSCPPYGPHFIVDLSEMVFDDDVAFVRAEVVREQVVTSVDLQAWDASARPPGAPLTLRVFTETNEEACIHAFAMDRAGNETRLGPAICEVDPVVIEEEDALDDRGCTCTSTGGAGGWGLAGLMGLVFWVRRRG